MLTLKTNAFKYKDANGNMQDVGAVVGEKTTDVSFTKSGVPADAKETGDKIAEISESFHNHKNDRNIHVTSAEKEVWNNKSDFTGNYSDLTGKPTIPTKTSELTNDSDFLTQHQDLSGYAKKATTLTGYGITDGATKKQFAQLSEQIGDLQTALIGVSKLIGGEE